MMELPRFHRDREVRTNCGALYTAVAILVMLHGHDEISGFIVQVRALEHVLLANFAAVIARLAPRRVHFDFVRSLSGLHHTIAALFSLTSAAIFIPCRTASMFSFAELERLCRIAGATLSMLTTPVKAMITPKAIMFDA
jgi:hypothetical protein